MTDMNLPNKDDFPLFYAYANSVCKGIKSKNARDEVKVELFSHLLDAYERNVATGMSSEDAEKNAVENMGDTEAVSETFKKLYPFSPESFAKSITSELIWGIVYSLLTLFGFTSGFTVGLYITAVTRIIRPIYLLKKINGFFTAVFYIAIINFIATGMIWAYQLYFTAPISTFYVLLTVNCTLASICYICLFLGFAKLDSRQNTSRKSEWFKTFLNTASLIFARIGMTVFKILNVPEALIILLFFFVYPIFILCTAYSLIAVYRFTYLLEDLNVFPEKQSKEKSLFYIITIFIILLSFFAVGFASARRQPKAVTPVYTANEDLEDIKDNMLALGFPKERLAELTNDEISKYRGAYKMYIDIEDEDYSSYHSSSGYATYTTYAFHLPADDKRPQRIRYIIYLEYQDSQKPLRNGFYFSPSYSDADPEDKYELQEYDGAFYRILCDVNCETKEIIPFYQNASSIGNSYTPVGCDFKFLKNSENRRAYFAQTVIPAEDTTTPTDGMGISTENDNILIYCDYYSPHFNGLLIFCNTQVENYLYVYTDRAFTNSYNHDRIYAIISDDSENTSS